MLYSAIYLRDRTIMSGDPFSDILKFTNAESLATGGFSAGGAWAIRFPAPDKIKFFAVVKGTCWVSIDGNDEPFCFASGDVGLLTAKRSFVLASDPSVVPVDAMALFSGAGRSTVTLPGAQLVSAQLSQLLFIQILRAHLQTSSPMTGWLRALGNPRIAPALRLMHGDPARSWHLDELASACAMSRTTFASHFRASAGVAPLAYLAEWRMRLAQRRLREENAPVAVVAQSLGYSSESAFSHAFKRMTGHSPKAYRQVARNVALPFDVACEEALAELPHRV